MGPELMQVYCLPNFTYRVEMDQYLPSAPPIHCSLLADSGKELRSPDSQCNGSPNVHVVGNCIFSKLKD